MSRWLPTVGLLAALVLPGLIGCSSSPTTGTGPGTAFGNGSGSTGKGTETAKESGKTRPHDPG